MSRKFDYIVVGAGSAGAVVASRLSEDPARSVCLLEAGGEGDGLLVRMPAGVAVMLPTRINNWGYKTVPQKALNNRRGYQPRGKCLGGSSAINAMIYIRGNPADYDEWAELGNRGWGFDDVLPIFKRSENNSRGAGAWHGIGGPLNVMDLRSPTPFGEMFVQAAMECGHVRNEDFNAASQEGFGPFQVTQKNGERMSAAAAYLTPNRARPNLTIVTRAHATKLVVEGTRVKAVRYRVGREELEVSAAQEVVLSAGVFATPQLLMLSGIGPEHELFRHGIQVRHALNGVGQNLQDHIDYTAIYKSSNTDLLGVSGAGIGRMKAAWSEWQSRRTGLLTSPFAEAGGFVRSNAGLEWPDIQFHFVVGIVDNHARKFHPGHGYSCHATLLRPMSRGRVTLNSADPLKPPRIDPRFLSVPRDMKTLTKGVRIMREILRSPALKSIRGKELYVPADDSDKAIEDLIRRRADTIYHPVGTCRMGADEAAVVGPDLKVHGVEGLRIADASIMPRIPAGNTNAACIMIGEKCADLVKAGS